MATTVKFMNLNSHTYFVSIKVKGAVNYCMTYNRTSFAYSKNHYSQLALIHQNNLSPQKKIATHKYN